MDKKSRRSYRIPIVYSPNYNISFFGLENILHSFDTNKYGRIFEALSNKYGFSLQDIYVPEEMFPQEDLLLIHTKEYLQSLNSSSAIAAIAEVPLLAILPSWLLKERLLKPMLYATSGTNLATKLAFDFGWAINLSGGYHHAKANRGEGFCFYADVALTIKKLYLEAESNGRDRPRRIGILDLDAHQGNGYISLLPHVQSGEVEVFDVYNGDIYPGDSYARQVISYDFPISSGTKDDEYLTLLRNNLPQFLAPGSDSSTMDLLFYNAGTDIFKDDPLGQLKISREAIIARDELVFSLCRSNNIPIVMVLSGGYSRASANIIFSAIDNLVTKNIISLPLPSHSPFN